MSDYLRPEYMPLFTQVQDFIANQLNSDQQLSALGIEFLPEHRLDIEYGIKNNLGKQGIVGIVNTLKGTYGGHDGSTNAWEIEAEVDVLENPPVRRAQMKKMGLSAGTTADIINWVQESLCAPSSPTYGKFCAMEQEMGEDSGIIVGKSRMKTFALADISAIISGEHNWICPYALASDLSALSGEVDELNGRVDDLNDVVEDLSANSQVFRTKTDLTVYEYTTWNMSEYQSVEGEAPTEYDPPIQFVRGTFDIEGIGQIDGQITESEVSPDTHLIINDSATIIYEVIPSGQQYYPTTTMIPQLNPSGTKIEKVRSGIYDVRSCVIEREYYSTSDRLAKISDLDKIEDSDGNKIYANRTVEIAEVLPPKWTISDGTSTHELTGLKTNSEWEDSSTKYQLYMVGTDTWYLKYYTKVGTFWVTRWNEGVSGDEETTRLTFPTHGFTASWGSATSITQDELALSSSVAVKRDIDDYSVPAEPSSTNPILLGTEPFNWDASQSRWISDYGFIEKYANKENTYYVYYQGVEDDVVLAPPTYKGVYHNDYTTYEVKCVGGQIAKTTDIPTKTSELTNDSGFATETYVNGIVGDINTALDNINGEVI